MATLTIAIVLVLKCCSDAIWLLFGRAKANDPSQARTNHVCKNCPTHVSSPKKDLTGIHFITSTSSWLIQTQGEHTQQCVQSVFESPKAPSGTIRFVPCPRSAIKQILYVDGPNGLRQCFPKWFCCSRIENERNHSKYKDKDLLFKWIWIDLLKTHKTRGFLTNRNCPVRVPSGPAKPRREPKKYTM